MVLFNSMYKTKLPFNFYLTIGLTFVVLILLIPDSLIKALFYSLFVFFFFYIAFSRNACTVTLTTERLQVKYIYPWEKNISIPISSITQIEYEKGFYDFISDKPRSVYNFPKHCSDLLIIIQKDDEHPNIQIEINTRFLEFNRTLKKLNTLVNP